MINQKYAFTIKFKIIKYKLKMLKMRKNMTTLYALLKLVNKNCKCSLCDKKQNLVYETRSYAINHNFCLCCVKKHFINKNDNKT